MFFFLFSNYLSLCNSFFVFVCLFRLLFIRNYRFYLRLVFRVRSLLSVFHGNFSDWLMSRDLRESGSKYIFGVYTTSTDMNYMREHRPNNLSFCYLIKLAAINRIVNLEATQRHPYCEYNLCDHLAIS